jgi:drug/metabolite transporter (DMT)-like permease
LTKDPDAAPIGASRVASRASVSGPAESLPALWRYLLPLLVMILWGSLPVANKIGVASLSPLSFAAWRAVIAALMFVPVLPFLMRRNASRNWPPSAGDLGWLAVVGALQTALFFYGVSEGLRRTPAGVAAVILNMQPLLTALLAYLALGERLSLRTVAGLSIAFLSLPFVTLDGRSAAFDPVGYGALAAATLCWSVSILVFKRKLASRVPPVAATIGQLWIGALILLAACIAAGRTQTPEFTSAMVNSVLYTALFGTCIPYVLWFVLLRRLSASHMSAFTFLIPVFAVIFAYIVLGETLSNTQLLGAAGAVSGVALIVLSWRARRS